MDGADGRSDEWRDGFNHGLDVVAFWLEFQHTLVRCGASPAGLSRIGMAKSALLGRLMRGEEIRRRPCPTHQGKMWCSWFGSAHTNFECCGGTGWLPNEPAAESNESRSDAGGE